MKVLLDTSVLTGANAPGDVEAAISVASLAELHFGLLAVGDQDERARRARRLGLIESAFDPLPIDADVAREWGRLAALTRRAGRQPQRRAMDLAIAATASVHGVPLLTANPRDFDKLDLDVRAPPNSA